MGIFGSSQEAQPRGRRGHHRRRQRHRRGVRHRTRPPRRQGRVQRHRRDRRARQRPTRSSPQAARRWRLRCDVSRLDDVIQLAEGVAGLVRRPADPGDQQRRRRCGRHGDRRDRHRRLELGARHQPVGPDPRLPRVRADPARGRATAGIINVASAAAFGAAPGMAAYNVSKAGVLSLSETLAAELSGTGVNVTVLCPTFVKTNIVDVGPHHREVDAAGRPADALDRLLPRAGGPHLPGHPRPRRPVLHAAARRPDRLGHQAFHPDGVHPRRRPQPRVSTTQ